MSQTVNDLTTTHEQPAAPSPNAGLKVALGGAAFGLVIGILLGAFAMSTRTKPQTSASPITTTNEAAPRATAGNLDVRGIVEKVQNAVVSITSNSRIGGFRRQAAGTGMILTADGRVLTNAHVVEGASQVRVTIPGNGTHTARVLGSDAARDVALLQVDGVSALTTVTLGSSANMHVGDPVVTVGNALALDGGPTVTTGIISALERSIDTSSGSLGHLIQTDAAINSGDSGGPLLDSAGHVIGMNTAVAGGAQNIGFAIAVDQIKPLLDGLSQGTVAPSTESSGYLGVNIVDGETGPTIASVLPGSPAAQAGLAPDDVVLSVGGRPVSSADELVGAIRAHKPGDRVDVRVRRQDADRTVTVQLGARP